jgi:hypothetical protein
MRCLVCVCIYLIFLSHVFSTSLPHGWDDALCFLVYWLAVPCRNHCQLWAVLINFSFCKFLMLFSAVPITVIVVFNYYKFQVLLFFFFVPVRVMWYLCGACGNVVVKALCYKPEGHGFDSQ